MHIQTNAMQCIKVMPVGIFNNSFLIGNLLRSAGFYRAETGHTCTYGARVFWEPDNEPLHVTNKKNDLSSPA
jgi:hypothetical protein